MMPKMHLRSQHVRVFEPLELCTLYKVDLGYCTAEEIAIDLVAAVISPQTDSKPIPTNEIYGPKQLALPPSAERIQNVASVEPRLPNVNQIQLNTSTTSLPSRCQTATHLI